MTNYEAVIQLLADMIETWRMAHGSVEDVVLCDRGDGDRRELCPGVGAGSDGSDERTAQVTQVG
jgi:hypothetical protein